MANSARKSNGYCAKPRAFLQAPKAIAECGIKDSGLLIIPQSEFRNQEERGMAGSVMMTKSPSVPRRAASKFGKASSEIIVTTTTRAFGR